MIERTPGISYFLIETEKHAWIVWRDKDKEQSVTTRDT